MILALGTALMVLGAVFEVLDLSVCAVASLFVAFVYIEIGAPYTFIVWLLTSLLSFIFFPGSVIWIEYLLVFGIYPIIKAYVERLPRVLWIILKAVYINAVLVALIFLFELIFKTIDSIIRRFITSIKNFTWKDVSISTSPSVVNQPNNLFFITLSIWSNVHIKLSLNQYLL